MLRNAHQFSKIFSSCIRHYIESLRIERAKGTFPNEDLYRLLQAWSREALDCANIEVEHRNVPRLSEPHILVGNHMSYLDIPLVASAVPCVFVSKAEVGRWPILGPATKRAGTVLVKRESSSSRRNASSAIAKAIQEQGHSVCIYPSGTTSISEAKPWRYGAFLIAKRYGIPVLPFTLNYSPARIAAYIDDDALAPHLWQLINKGGATATIEFGDPVTVTDPESDARDMWQQCHNRLAVLQASTGREVPTGEPVMAPV